MLKIILKSVGILFLCSGVTYGHGGGVDSTGGHNNKMTGEYHCHKEPCFSNHRQSEDAFNEAKQQQRAVSTLYNRKDWPHWVDYDKDCQNARAEAMIDASSEPVKFKRNKGCVVSWGKWFDPFTSKTFTKASNLDVDHIVPLKEAHISGGDTWSRKQRRAFANDPENLLVVSASENREKGAKDPAKWLPDIVSYHCEYVKRWLYVKSKYALNIDSKEDMAINAVLAGC